METKEFYPKHAEKLAAIAAGLGCKIAPRNGHYNIFADLTGGAFSPDYYIAAECDKPDRARFCADFRRFCKERGREEYARYYAPKIEAGVNLLRPAEAITADLLRRLAAPAKTAAKEIAQRIARDDAQDARTFADLTALLSPAGLKPSELPTLEEVRSGGYLNLSAIGIHSATAHDLTRPFHGEPTGLKITVNTAGALIQIVKILTAERGISRAS